MCAVSLTTAPVSLVGLQVAVSACLCAARNIVISLIFSACGLLHLNNECLQLFVVWLCSFFIVLCVDSFQMCFLSL